MAIVIILGGAFMLSIAFLIILHISNYFHLKNQQKEWDELKETLLAFAPYITEDELRAVYINFINQIKCYYSVSE